MVSPLWGDHRVLKVIPEVCPAWVQHRLAFVAAIGGDLSRQTLVQAMARNQNAWQAVTSFCEAVMESGKG